MLTTPHEKDATTNQWSTTSGLNLNNSLNFAGTDETNTFGINAVLQLVPEKWSCTFNAMGRYNDWDDTELTTIVAQLDYAVASKWTITAGYGYEKYDFRDADTSSNLLMPQAVYIFMNGDNGPYDANVIFTRLSYRF